MMSLCNGANKRIRKCMTNNNNNKYDDSDIEEIECSPNKTS